MADSTSEIVLKLSIDDKSYEARIDIGKQRMVDLAKEAGVSEKQLVKAFEEMQSGVDQTAESVEKVKNNFEKLEPAIKQAGEEGKKIGYNLGEDFDGVNVTLADLGERLDDLKARFGAAAIGGEEYNRLAGEIQVVQGHLRRVKDDLTQTNNVTNLATARTGALRGSVTQVTHALMELDPRIGSVVQGFSPFINGFNTAALKSGGFKDTLKALGGQLAGPMGIGLAIAGASLLIKGLSDYIDVIDEKAKKAAEQGLKAFERQLLRIGSHDIDKKIKDIKDEIKSFQELLDKEYNPLKGSEKSIRGGITGMSLGPGFFSEEIAKLKADLDVSEQKLVKITDKEKEINEQKKLKVGALELEVDSLDKQIKAVENIEGAEKIILDLVDKKANKQKEINLLLETTEEKNKRLVKASDEVFAKAKKELEIAQSHAETLLSIESQNDFLMQTLKTAHFAQTIDLYKRYGRDVTELQLELNNKLIQIEAQAAVERKKILTDITQWQQDDDIQLDNLKIASREELKQAQINSIADQYEREYALLVHWRDKELERFADDADMKSAIISQFRTKEQELEESYFDWKWQKYLDDHRLLESTLDAMFAGYDTFFSTLTDATMTGSERLKAVWANVRDVFINSLANMLQQYIINAIAQLAVSKTTQATEIAAATVTGSAIAAAYAPAAAMASIASFGGAALAGSAGLAGTVSLAYLLSVPKIPGFAQGGILPEGKAGFFEGTHREIVAPEKDFITVVNDLVKQSSIQINGGLGGNLSGDNTLLRELTKLNSNFEKYSNRPAIAVFDNDTARAVGDYYDYDLRREH